MRFISDIDLNLLVVFETIHAKGGVSGAARHLNLSQPTISHSLARLRDTLGDRLFVRSGNQLVPTSLAQAMVGPVRDALRSVDVALAKATCFDPARTKRSFTVGMRAFIEVPSFPELTARILREAPGASISSAHYRRQDLVSKLANGAMDIVLDLRRPLSPGLFGNIVQRDDLVVIARPAHPLLRQGLDLSAYMTLDHVFVSPRSTGLGIEDAALAERGLCRNIAVRCQHAATASRIVATTDMICTLPRSYAEAVHPLSPNRILPLPLSIEPNELLLYWHETANDDPGGRWLRSIVEDHFSSPFARETSVADCVMQLV